MKPKNTKKEKEAKTVLIPFHADRQLDYDCSNYYFEIEQGDGDKKYGKSKEHRPNPSKNYVPKIKNGH